MSILKGALAYFMAYKAKRDQKHNKILKFKMTLQAPILTFKLLRKAEKMLLFNRDRLFKDGHTIHYKSKASSAH